jgi:hypothetical protein
MSEMFIRRIRVALLQFSERIIDVGIATNLEDAVGREGFVREVGK